MKLLSGTPISDNIYKQVKIDVNRLKAAGIKPKLVVIMVGDDPVSRSYVEKKREKGANLGIEVEIIKLDKSVREAELERVVEENNQKAEVSGIIIQLPLPKTISPQKITWKIQVDKDVDGFQMKQFRPPAPMAIIELLLFYHIPVQGKVVALVGYGTLVGKPLSVLLRKQGAQLVVCDRETENIKDKLLSADIIVTAVGKNNIITEEMVKREHILVDAGTSSEDGGLVGDIDKSLYEKVRAVTPVPGGVGPVTMALLFKNVVTAAKKNVSTLEDKQDKGITKDNWQWPLFKKNK